MNALREIGLRAGAGAREEKKRIIRWQFSPGSSGAHAGRRRDRHALSRRRLTSAIGNIAIFSARRTKDDSGKVDYSTLTLSVTTMVLSSLILCCRWL